MSHRSSSSATSRGSQQSRAATTAVFSNPATAPPSLPSSPRSTRFLDRQDSRESIASSHRPPLPSSMPSTGLPSPEFATDSVNSSSNSLVGQLLSTSGPAIGAGSTPYGLIVSARRGVGPSCLGQQVEPQGEDNGNDVHAHIPRHVPDQLDSMHHAPEITVPVLPGYADWMPVYAINYIHVFRAKVVSTGQPVVMKLCTVNHLDTLARLRFEWKILADQPTPSSRTSLHSQSSGGGGGHYLSATSSGNPVYTLANLPTIVRPYTWEYLPEGGMALIYNDDVQNLTVQEAFLPDAPPLIIAPSMKSSVASPVSPALPAKPRTQSDLIKILSVFSAVVEVLSVAHNAGVTHNNINIFSIMVSVNKDNNTVQGKLGGWHLASRLEREELGRGAGGAMLRGENPAPLQYIAPECTGRMNRSVDYRADFYSLGIALYELVVGFLPFRSTEPLELIHQHIAQPPKPPAEVNASIPPAISAVVMRLLEKNAEDRYQTASGLKADFDKLIRLLVEGKPLTSIKVGELDTTSQFVITEKLYGREKAVETLTGVYRDCISNGGCKMVMLMGSSGIGKSRLVNEIQRPVVENKGYFTTGKFDQYKRGFSFFTLVQTLQDLIRQVLSEPLASLARWRTDTIRAFDNDAAVLTDVIPELKILLGPDYKIEPLANLGPAERETRFREAFARLLAVFSRKGLVIFVDDLQWCSDSEFELISKIAEEVNRKIREQKEIVGDSKVTAVRDKAEPKAHVKQSRKSVWSGGILIIGAYRDTEVDDAHPLLSMLQGIQDMQIDVIEIHLDPLSQESVRRIIGDTLHRNPDADRVRDDPELQTLTELVYAKTQGNPFFVVQLLKSLHRSGKIVFDFSAKGGGRWRFNLTSIEADDLPPTVVDLLVKQMLKLSEATRTVMMLAACIGTEKIGLNILSVAAGKKIEETAADLWGALDAGLILPTSGNYNIPLTLEANDRAHREEESMANGEPMDIDINTPADDEHVRLSGGGYFGTAARYSPASVVEDEEVTYRFLHDRVQQAAYYLIPETERPGVHRMIGTRLFETVTEERLEDGMLYEIVNQLNHWLAPLESDERKALMDLNLRAGKKALSATAFNTALGYFLVAKRLLDDAEKEEEEFKAHPSNRLSFGLNSSTSLGRMGFIAQIASDRMLDHFGTKRSKPRRSQPWTADLWAAGVDINLALMEGHYASGNYVDTVALADVVLPRCQNDKDKVRCLILKLNAQLAQGYLHGAIETGLQGLSVLSWEVPLVDEEAAVHAAMIRPRIMLDAQSIKNIGKMNRLEDENLLLLQEIISTITLPVYMARPLLLPAVCYTSVAITLEFGISAAGAYPMLMTGVILGSEVSHDNMLRSYAYGRLAMNIIEKEATTHAFAPAIYEVYAGHIGVFHQPMSEVLRYFQLAITEGLKSWNVNYTIFSMVELPAFSMLSGENLNQVHQKMTQLKPQIRRFNSEHGQQWLGLPLQFLLNLRGMGNADPLDFDGEEISNETVARVIKSDNMSIMYLYYMYKLIIAAIFGHWEVVAQIATENCEPIILAVRGTFYLEVVQWYTSVAFLEMYKTITKEQQKMLERNISELRECASRAKGTWLHKVVLLEAEMKNVMDGTHQLEILDLFDHAISLAMKSGFIHDAAFINERCALWLKGFSKRRAAPYLREALRQYQAWGAVTKASELRKQFSDDILLKENRPTIYRSESDAPRDLNYTSPRQSPRSSRIGGTDYGFEVGFPYTAPSMASSRDIFASENDTCNDDSASHSASDRNNESSSLGSELDFRTVLKASLVISEGIHLEEVIVSLMKSVLQTAGADYGVLILKEDNNLHVETVGLLDQVSILEHEPLHTRADLVPITVVNIVASLGEQILRDGDDAKFDLTYGRDSYFQTRRAKSVLCMPIQNQLKTMGVLYLENKIVNHAFTRQRQELLNLLCTQAAVTIDKARLYRQMELAKKAAEEATAEKSSFLANMSHEIRTPFNALLSCSIFLLDTPLSEQQREYVETIRNSAVLTLQIIDGILDFSKIEHGAINLTVAPFSLRDCIESALQLVAEPAATKDLELAYRNCCPDIELVHGDITRFRQCVINMIGNAVKFTQEGHILITTEAEPIPGEDGKHNIFVSVKDTGIGIPKASFDRLFRAFSQVDTSTRRTYGGTGLGLAISKKLAQMMGGDIWFESEEGVGTTFHLFIVASITPKVWTKDSRLVGKHIIVADTHPVSGGILADELEVEGLDVTRTNTPASTMDALNKAGQGHYCVALIDLSVDESYGLLKAVKAFDPKIKVILMSRFGATLPPTEINDILTLSFVRPAPRSRYVQAVLDALNPNLKKQAPLSKTSETELLKSLARRHPLNILLAEDNPVNTRVALQHLKRMGYSAKHAKDGIEALELCEEAAEKGDMFDVILMDIQMPRADGIETSREIHRRYKNGERPTIIALTANATAGDREKCQQAGMLTHIAKPILPNDLATALMSTPPLQKQLRQSHSPPTPTPTSS